MAKQTVIVRGTLSDGYEIIGPFESFDEASLWAYEHPSVLPDWIMGLSNPNNTKEYTGG